VIVPNLNHGFLCLLYHEVETPNRSLRRNDPGYLHYVVQQSCLYQQLCYLFTQNIRVVTVSAALCNRQNDARVLVMTFDDGCESDAIVAAPALLRFGFCATFYVVAGRVGNPATSPRVSFGSWSMMAWRSAVIPVRTEI
jgi:hypothetical protein